jgi:1,4-dihydroxy-2-naphthoyl-CoA hydrolase
MGDGFDPFTIAYCSFSIPYSLFKMSPSKTSNNPYYTRTIRFQDTDAAGVVYFANVLAICHEAYEASLIAHGIPLRSFFSSSEAAIPIVHANVDFWRPMFCGDVVQVQLTPQACGDSEFEIAYQIVSSEENRTLARSLTRHVCIEPTSRKRRSLPEEMVQWLESTVRG